MPNVVNAGREGLKIAPTKNSVVKVPEEIILMITAEQQRSRPWRAF
jgi:hypothetical protein